MTFVVPLVDVTTVVVCKVIFRIAACWAFFSACATSRGAVTLIANEGPRGLIMLLVVGIANLVIVDTGTVGGMTFGCAVVVTIVGVVVVVVLLATFFV